MKNITSAILILVAFCITESLSGLSARLEAGTTKNPWPSFRQNLLNTGAALDFGYPTTPKIAWKVNRSDRPDKPGTPAGAGGSAAIDKGMVFTTGQGIVEARDQYTGNLIWSKAFPWTDNAMEPADTPDDWCYGDIPTLGSGNTGVCYVPDLSQCPSWCLECTTVKPDCSSLSVINPLRLGEGYGQFISSPTLDTPSNLLAFGTFDARVIALNMETGSTVWERTPFKDPGGPNEGRPWYDQKFAWHLSAPSIADGHVYIGSFLPSFYYIFRYPPFGKAIYGSDFHTYWMGHDGWFYALDENDGSILWTWNPQGCGVANVPPVDSNGNVYAQDDFHTTTCNGLLQSFDSNGNPRWTLGPVPVAQGGSPSISGSTIFIPMSDGVLWALDKDSGALKWTYHGGFCIKGNSGLTSSTAVDERHGLVLGASDTGHIFVLDKKTGRLVREAYLGVPGWKPGDNIPQSGFWFPGAGSMAIAPSQKLLYIAGTDYERAWQGQFTKGKEKLFCYYYGGPGAKLVLLWEHQFCLDDDACADLDSQHIVRGWEEQSSSFYNVPSPALADGHVYYNSMNGKVYCFGRPFRSTP